MGAGLTDDVLLRGTAAVYTLADRLGSVCRGRDGGQSYSEPASRFLDYVGEVATATKGFLESIAPADDIEVKAAKLRLGLLKEFWRELHQYVKPVIDAHNLATPTPLLQLAASRLRAISGLEDACFATLLTPELMYFQSPHTSIGDVARSVMFIPGSSGFPDKLGFVQIPYALSNGLFNNLIIFHELGHFIYEELGRGEILSSLTDEMNDRVAKLKLDADRAEYCADALRRWSEEIFCDLVAARLVGPSFALAFADFISLLGIPNDDARAHGYGTHPSPALRYREQLRQLEADGWMPHLRAAGVGSVFEAMGDVARGADEQGYWEGADDPMKKGVPAAFLEIVPTIRKAANGLTETVRPAAEVFARLHEAVYTMLRNGIVPSTFDGQDVGKWPENATAVVNAAVCFIIGDFRRLADRVKMDMSETARWGMLRNMVESWTLKAVEDLQLLGSGVAVP